MKKELQENVFLKKLNEITKLLRTQKNVFTVDDLCLYTGLSKSTVYKLTSAKAIPYYKGIGHKIVMFKKREIDQWLTSNPVVTLQDVKLLNLKK